MSRYSKYQKERREQLKKQRICVVCGADLPINCEFFRCFKCRVQQTQADEKYRKKKKIIDYFKSLVSDAEIVGSKFTSGIEISILMQAILIMKGE